MWFIPFLFRASLSKSGLSRAKRIFTLGDIGWLWSSQLSGLKNLIIVVETYNSFSLRRMFLKRLRLIFLLILLYL